MTRAEKVAQAQMLRAQGLKRREIAERMGCAPRTVGSWFNDPDLSKQRANRARYSRPCVDCGRPTDGSGGFSDQRERCNACARQHQHDTRKWTADEIVEAIRLFHRENGRPPRANEWNHADGRDSRFPWTTAVLREWGRWKNAIRAAGFECYSPMQPDRAESAERREEIVRLYLVERLGMPTIAVQLGLDVSSVDWHLRHAGVKRRTHSDAQRLRWLREGQAA